MNLRQLALVALAALAVGGTAAAQVAQPGPGAATPPPPPPPNGSVATPSVPLIGTPVPSAAPSAVPAASPSPAPARRGRRAAPSPEASPSDTPEPPQFQTMDGVWEVQMQPLTTFRTIYSHLYVTQKSDQLTGRWVKDNPRETLTFTGTFDGRLFKLTLKNAKGDTYTMSGYAENFGDMVGLYTSADPKDKGTPFTASHRKKERIT
ncbi:hypothetical protein WPS_16130 [Vulcanimicrobium alpinum]|uniref:DUF1579 domain-containing protein n=1 Tax=Vulcanimicrobium alpinum TaxID=3016050 RepID=A0AAN1XY13_UNVUL|nr:hypothetical protein [Vulcanimicrobium alpinum]BDE06337.1 hypothetical protein WPS_16130 [Vulcanimicrobium alpinum]